MDTRSEIKMFIAIAIGGIAILIMLHVFVNLRYELTYQIWDVPVLIILGFLWLRYGAAYITDLVLKGVKKKDERRGNTKGT